MKRAGYLAIGAAAVLWSLGGSLGAVIIKRGASPLEIAEVRAWLASLAFGAIVYAKRRRGTGTPGRVPLALSIGFGLSIASANYFYYTAIGLIPVAMAVVIQYTAPGLIVLWLAVAEHRRPSSRVIWSLLLALVGVALLAELPSVLASRSTGLSLTGVLAAAASAVGFAAYILTGEHVQRGAGPEGSLLRGFTVAGIFWLLVQAPRGLPNTILAADVLPGVIAIAIGATIIPFALFVWGLARIGPARAGIASTLEPLSAAFVAWVWLGQTLSGVQLAGAAMVVAGIAVIQSEEPAAVPEPAPLE
jgi:drug/metabolite transporter, DME family